MRRPLAFTVAAIALAALHACSEDAPNGGSPDASADSGSDVSLDVMSAPDASDAGDGPLQCVPFTAPAGCTSDAGDVPGDLRCTGLYADFDQRVLACDVREFAPAFPFWSDGAKKRRFISLPAGAKIDVSDMDEWTFPIGTRLWKDFEIALPSGGAALVETRLFWKMTDPNVALGTWHFATYVWSFDGKTATRKDDGVTNVRGTTYEIPTKKQCGDCHNGRQDRVLGFDAIAMSAPEATGLTYAELLRAGQLTTTAPGGLPASDALQIPGTATERAALGYLHASCGVGCHNERAPNPANLSGLHMKLMVGRLNAASATDTVVSGANKHPGNNWPGQPAAPDGGWFDIHPGDVARSLLPTRMSIRDLDVDGGRAQMPPLVSHAPDDAGVAAITSWIMAMTIDAGYPAPATP